MSQPSKQNRKSDIPSIVAIFIALMALFISIWQGCEERRHNRLSVTPILTFDNISHNRSKTIKLKNVGLGPARILSFEIMEGDAVYSAENGNPWNKLSFIKNIGFSEMYYFDYGAVIKPDQSYNILTWNLDSLRSLDIEIKVIYESIYGEEYISTR